MLVIAFVMVVVIALGIAQRGFLGGMLGLFAQQRVAVFLGDLVVIGVNFAERQEAVAIAAIIDESSLERRLHPRHLGEIDIPLELLALGRFEVKLLDPVSLDDGNAGFLPVPCVDQHAHGHQ